MPKYFHLFENSADLPIESFLLHNHIDFVWFGWFNVLNATFNNTCILVVSCQSVLLVEETGEPGETTDLSQVTDKFITLCCIV